MFDPLDPLDPMVYEICFPGAVTGEAETTCPHCKAILTVPVDDPTERQAYTCSNCRAKFVVDWGG